MAGANYVEVVVGGNTTQLESALERAGVVAESSAGKIKASYAEVGAAAAKAAAAAGASADEQAAAAGRAAAKQVESNASITKSQMVAADAAARAAAAAGGSADVQAAAARRAAAAQLESESSLIGSHKRLEDANKASADSASEFSTQMGRLGKVTLIAASAAIAGVTYESVKLADSFEKSVAQIAGSAGIPIAAAKRIGDAFLDTAGKSVYSGNEMAAAFAPVAGQLKMTEGRALDAADSLKFMTAAGDLAEGSQSDLTTTTAALSSVMQAYNLKVGQAAQASDILFNTSQAINVPVSTLAGTVDKLHSRLGDLAPSLGDVSTLMVELGEHGVQGSRGATTVTSALQTLLSGSTNVTTVLNELGVHTLTNAQGKFIGLEQVIKELQPAMAGLNQTSQDLVAKTLFGSGAAQILNQIIASGVPGYQKAQEAATKLGTAHRAAAEQSKTLGGEIKTLEATLSDLGTKLGLVLVPIITQFGQSLANTITWMEKHKSAAEALAITIGSVLGFAVAVFAEQKAVKFGNSVKSMVGDLGKLKSAAENAAARMLGLGTASDTATPQVTGAGSAAGASEAEVTTLGASASTATPEVAALGTAATTASPGVVSLGADSATAGAGELTLGTDALTATPEVAGLGVAAKTALSYLGPLALAAAAGYGAGKLANDILGTNPSNPYNVTGKTAAQIVGGDTTLTPGERLRGSGEVHGRYSLAKSLTADNLTPAQINAMVDAAQATGQFPGGKYNPNVKPREKASSTTGGSTSGVNAASFSSSQSWASTLLQSLGIRPTQGSITALEDWQTREGPFGTQAAYNPLNVSTSGSANISGTGKFDGTPAENYGSPSAGVAADIGYLKTYAPGVIAALRTGSVANVQAAVKNLGKNAFGNDAFGAPWAGSTVSVPAGTQTGTNTIPNPSVAASTQATQDALTNAIDAAVEKYQSAAKSATSGPLKVLDEQAAAAIKALGDKYEAQAKGQSGPDLKQTVSEFHNSLTSLENTLNPGIKNAKTMESVDSKLDKVIEGYKAGAASASSAVVASIETGFAQMVQSLEKGFTKADQATGVKNALAAIQAQAKGDVALGTRGGTTLQSLQSAVSGSSFAPLKAVTNAGTPGVTSRSLGLPGGAMLGGTAPSAAHQDFDLLVKELNATHNKALEGLAKQLVATYNQAETAKDNILVADAKQNEAAATQKQTTIWMDASDEAVSAIKDMSQSIQDSFAAAATAITDASTLMTDAANAQSSVIADNAQTTVDTLAERGLYGLNLIAQQATVAGDKQKTAYDTQIAAAQSAVDSVTQTGDQAQAAQQAIVDSTTSQQNALIGQAQAHLNSVTSTQNVLVQQAQAAVDQGKAGAQAQLNLAQATASYAEAQANQQLTQAQDTANNAEAQASAALTTAQGQAATAVAAAQSALAAAQGQAQVAEAQTAADIAIEKEKATTQFAGSGTTVNIIGIPQNDASAIADATQWVLRSQYTAPAIAG